MSNIDLKYLGLDDSDILQLRAWAQTVHQPIGMQTASTCACGRHCGGPAATPICRIIEKLMEAGKEVRVGRFPPRHPSVCKHERDGKVTIYEYMNMIICEQCRSEVK